jgi:hypothetical protein
MEALFSGRMQHRAWRAKTLFPPQGIPPLPEKIAAGQAAYIQAHTALSQKDDLKIESEHIEGV